MRCRRARKLLSLRIDGRLASADAAAIEAHLGTCPGCSLARDRMERAWRRLGAVAAAVAPAPDGFARVLGSVELERTGRRARIAAHLAFPPRLLRPAAALAVAASLVVGAAGGMTLGRFAFGKRRADASPEAAALSEGFGLLPVGSPAAGLARALAGAEGRR